MSNVFYDFFKMHNGFYFIKIAKQPKEKMLIFCGLRPLQNYTLRTNKKTIIY